MALGVLNKDLRMKLRIKGNSLRLRISQSEVKQLKDNLQITEEIQFSKDSALRYTLQNQPGLNTIKADYSENSLLISLPETLAKDWLNSDQVGLEGIQENSENNFLKILVEKDFSCLSPRGDEDESDLLPNPKQS